ncbi:MULTISPECIES: hypothetical protein [Haloarcula]|uniref:hypothetical protein n=1 Tax=Haloarcula TaxID=2237 RepID=UPI0023E7874F|nr:hypothetical protein [Halomicroarcula sp. SHR3]
MTDGDTAVSSERELHTRLQALLHRAHTSGIDVEGAWECRNGAEHPDWDVVVTEMEKKRG